MIFLSDCFWHLKRKMHKDFRKILRSGISENLDKGIFTHRKCPSVEFTSFFSVDSFQSYYYIGTLKRRGHQTIFSYKSFREFSNSNARSRASKNPDSIRSTNAHDLLRLPLTIACARASSYCIRSQTFTNVYCSESHSAAVKDSPPGSP